MPLRFAFRVLGPTALLAVLVNATPAQTPLLADVEHDSTRLARMLQSLGSAQHIRVTVPQNLVDPDSLHSLRGVRVELYGPRFTDEGIYYVQFTPPRGAESAQEVFLQPLPLSQVFRVEARRNTWLAAAVTGAVAVGGAFLMRGLAGACPREPTCYEGGEIAGTTLLGAAVGGLVGGLVGSRIHRWKTVYRAGPAPPGSGNPLYR